MQLLKQVLFYIRDVLTETIVFRVFHRENPKELSFQFSNQIFVFYDVMLVVCADMLFANVLVGDGYGVTDKEN